MLHLSGASRWRRDHIGYAFRIDRVHIQAFAIHQAVCVRSAGRPLRVPWCIQRERNRYDEPDAWKTKYDAGIPKDRQAAERCQHAIVPGFETPRESDCAEPEETGYSKHPALDE